MLRELAARVFAKYVPFNYSVWATVAHDVQIQTCVRATQTSADYVLANMPMAKHFVGTRLTEFGVDEEGRDKLLKYALDAAVRGGLIMEFGVHSGSSVNFIADSIGGQPCHGFDSFIGLPEDWKGDSLAGKFSRDGVPPEVRPNVTLHIGWFDATVEPFIKAQNQDVSFIHIDCDLYSSTMTVLRACRERLLVGTVIVFDEYFNYPGWERHEVRAWREFVAEAGMGYEYIGYAARHYSVAVRITSIKRPSS